MVAVQSSAEHHKGTKSGMSEKYFTEKPLYALQAAGRQLIRPNFSSVLRSGREVHG